MTTFFDEPAQNLRKYILCPGYVASANDTDRHYISPAQLARLCGVPICQCSVLFSSFPDSEILRQRPGRTILRPRSDGNYTLPVSDTATEQ